MLIKSFFSALLFLFVLTAQASTSLIQEKVGVNKIEMTHLEPRAVILDDALVVFYRLKERKNKELIGFSVARTVDNNGKLIWEKDYVLKPEVLTTQGIAPNPVMYNGTLYLFGANGHKIDDRNVDHSYYQVKYNYFSSLQDLINHAEGGSAKKSARNLPARILFAFNFMSAVVHENQPNGSELLMTYISKDYADGFNYLSCMQWIDRQLNCQEYLIRTGFKYDGTLNLFNVDVSGKQETMMLTGAVRSDNMNVYLVDSPFRAQIFEHMYSMHGNRGEQPELALSGPPASAVQVDGKLVMYYKQPSTSKLMTVSLPATAVYNTHGWDWSREQDIVGGVHTGVSAIRFKDRSYVFYGNGAQTAMYVGE